MFVCFVFEDRILLCSSGLLAALELVMQDHIGLELTELPSFASRLLRLKACATAPLQLWVLTRIFDFFSQGLVLTAHFHWAIFAIVCFILLSMQSIVMEGLYCEFILFIYYDFSVLSIEPRTSFMFSQCFVLSLPPIPFLLLFWNGGLTKLFRLDLVSKSICFPSHWDCRPTLPGHYRPIPLGSTYSMASKIHE